MVIRRTYSRPLKEIIEELLKDAGIDQKLKERELVRLWDEVVGKTIARSTESVFVRERKLYVVVRSAVIRNELQMIRDGLRLELNQRIGENLIDDLIIR